MTDDLDHLQQQIEAAKARIEDEKPDVSDARGQSQAIRMSSEFIAAILVGGVLGFFADRWLGTMPVLFILGIILGGAAGVRAIMRQAGGDTK